MRRTLIVAEVVFLVSYFLSLLLDALMIRHAWAERNVVYAMLNAALLGIIFFVWKKKEHIYHAKIENYATMRRRWVHGVRDKLQILMLRLDYDEASKRTILEISEMLDRPALSAIDGKSDKNNQAIRGGR
jgi:hypothetical protein